MFSVLDDTNFASAIERVFLHSEECTDVLRNTNRNTRQHDMESISDAILDYIRHMEIEIGLAFDSAIERDIYDHGETPSEEVRRLPTFWQKRVDLGTYFQNILKKEMDFDKELLRQSLIRNQYVPITFSKRMACLLSMYTLVNGAYCFVRDVCYDNIFWEFILDYICFRVDLIMAFLGNSKVDDALNDEKSKSASSTGSKLSMNAMEALYEQASYSLFLWKVSRQLDYSWCHNRPLLLLNRQLMDKAMLLRLRFQRTWPTVPPAVDDSSISLLDNLYGSTKENIFFGTKAEATMEGLGSVLDKLIESSRISELNPSGQSNAIQSQPNTRPLPPSFIPGIGFSDYDYRSLPDFQSDTLNDMFKKMDGNYALIEDSNIDLKRILQSLLIWMYPPYPSLRLLWMPEGKRRGDNSTVDSLCFYGDDMRNEDEDIIKVLSDQALKMPLPPDTERQVLHALQYSLHGDNKDGGKITKRKKSSGANFNEALDSLLGRSAEARARRIVLKSNISPNTLPMLVESNPLIATECLIMLLSPFNHPDGVTQKEDVSVSLTLSEEEKNEYLLALTAMDMTLHSMEVVNRLATQPASLGKKADDKPFLHSEYLHLFLSHCISSCENIRESHLRIRSVRLVCVLLQSLIQSNFYNFGDLLVEIQAFCVQYSRIREASSLFKFIKSLE